MKETKPKNPNRPKAILGLLFALTFVMGWILGHQDARFGGIGFSPRLIGKDNSQAVDFSTFWRAWDLIEKKYDGKVDYQAMVYGAIRGMVQAVGDPYTAFLSPDEAKQLEDDLSGTLSGIGAEIGTKNGRITVISPISDSPAKKAGLLAGDIITKIDDTTTEGMDVGTAVSKIRGQAGTKVKLTILRGTKEIVLEITRATINVKSVEGEVKKGNIGYINIKRFDEKTTLELRSILDNYISKNITKIVLDLRDNPGGYLDESVTVSSEFIKSGIIVTERRDINSRGKIEYKATGSGKMTDTKYKIVVLINKGSASASEIVAGALKDQKRATLVGEKSFGKGSVQEIANLASGAKLRVTVAHWYTPEGKNIGKEGIEPDIKVELTEQDFNNSVDPQLNKALELLK